MKTVSPKKQDLTGKSVKELKELLEKERAALMKLKMDLRMGKLKDVHAPKKKRKAIARIKTMMKEKELI
jgi:ribosomal protein L29